MTIDAFAAFEPVGIERGVLALESASLNDWAGIILSSFDTTNTPEISWDYHPPVSSVRAIDATLHEAFDQYDDLLRRLSD